MNQFGKMVFLIGIVLILIGGFLWLFGDKLNWLGKLPGDIRIEKEGFSLYIPITTMILISLCISALLKLWQYLK
ncbi:MAG: DUF2905 domain-containing protein [Bacteroidia bacterium]